MTEQTLRNVIRLDLIGSAVSALIVLLGAGLLADWLDISPGRSSSWLPGRAVNCRQADSRCLFPCRVRPWRRRVAGHAKVVAWRRWGGVVAEPWGGSSEDWLRGGVVAFLRAVIRHTEAGSGICLREPPRRRSSSRPLAWPDEIKH